MDDASQKAYDLVVHLIKDLPLGVGQHSFALSFHLTRNEEDMIELSDIICRQTPTDMEKLITVLYNTDQRLDVMEKMLARSAQNVMDK